ncbi:hypothetical protein LY78DRAFT_651006 [Colletotrichum sublineola]|nr:hypothetical protein LY78DRAFT_651006 [Colletotrichum sublineola]
MVRVFANPVGSINPQKPISQPSSMPVVQGLSGSCFTPFPSVGKISWSSHSSQKQPTHGVDHLQSIRQALSHGVSTNTNGRAKPGQKS